MGFGFKGFGNCFFVLKGNVMKFIVISFVVIIFVVVGSFVVVVLKMFFDVVVFEVKESVDDYFEDGDEKVDKKKKVKKDDGYGKKESFGNSLYYKFSCEFVVLIMCSGQVISLVILYINLEIDFLIVEKLFLEEFVLCDNIMMILIVFSNDGWMLECLMDINNYEMICLMILMNLKDFIDDGIKNVLIVDMVKQNF